SCLVVAGGSAGDGANVEQNACTGTQSQWRLEPLADGSVRFVARHSGKVLDLSFCGLANGTNLVQWAWLDNVCQRYHLLRVTRPRCWAAENARPPSLVSTRALRGDLRGGPGERL